MKKPASEEKLAELHNRVAEIMLECIEPSTDDEGNVVHASPAMLATVTKFLKDNEITCNTGEHETTALDELSDMVSGRRGRKRVMDTPLDTLN